MSDGSGVYTGGGGGGSISNSQLLAMRSVMNDANIC